MKTIATWCLAVLAAATAPAAALAQSEPLDIRQTYSGVSTIPIYDIATYNTYAKGGTGMTNSFSIDAGAFSFSDPFLKSSANTPLLTYFLGVASYASGVSSTSDDDNVSADAVALPQHLVLALTSGYAAGLVSGGQDFATIFPAYDENKLIADLATIGSNSDNTSRAQKDAAVDELFSFGQTVNDRGGLTPALGGPLSLLSFSSATLVGQGQASLIPLGIPVPVTPPVTAAVPEPATWAMMIAGFGLLGLMLRRRSLAEVRAATAA